MGATPQSIWEWKRHNVDKDWSEYKCSPECVAYEAERKAEAEAEAAAWWGGMERRLSPAGMEQLEAALEGRVRALMSTPSADRDFDFSDDKHGPLGDPLDLGNDI